MASLMTSIRQVGGGRIIKSGDTASVFSYEIIGNDGLPAVISGTGKLSILNSQRVAFFGDVEVVDGKFSFRFDRVIPEGNYYLELKLEGYIFPTDLMRIKVVRSLKAKEMLPEADDPKLKALAEELLKSGFLAGGEMGELPDLVALYTISKI